MTQVSRPYLGVLEIPRDITRPGYVNSLRTWKWPLIYSEFSHSMVIFHSYVNCFPEGISIGIIFKTLYQTMQLCPVDIVTLIVFNNPPIVSLPGHSDLGSDIKGTPSHWYCLLIDSAVAWYRNDESWGTHQFNTMIYYHPRIVIQHRYINPYVKCFQVWMDHDGSWWTLN